MAESQTLTLTLLGDFIFHLNLSFKLDNLRWFAECHTQTSHFLLCGLWPPNTTSAENFCTMHLLPKFHHPTFTHSEVIILTNTNK